MKACVTGGTGFTLTEVMAAVVIVGILAAVALPGYRKALERSYWREAQGILLTIYSGERTYYLASNPTTYYDVDESQTGTALMAQWRKIHMDNPNLATVPVTYAVTFANATAFTAQASRNSGPCSGSTLTIDQDRVLAPDPSATPCWCGSC
jgi:type IV pilus assembly protein PilE